MGTYKDRLFSAMLGVMTFIVFQPFPFPSDWRRYPVILAFMAVSVACVLMAEFLVTKVFGLPNDLSRGIEYLTHRNLFFAPINIILLTISIATLFYLADAESEIDYFSLESLSYLIVCLVCISLFQRLYWRNRYNAQILSQELSEAQRINGMLQERERMREKTILHETEEKATDEMLCISGSTKESVQMCVADLLFIESNGNYITVHLQKDGKLKKVDVRTSIKDVLELLAPYPAIMRCHRAFIVNLANVTSLERRNSGMELEMRGFNERIPVSKSYIQELKQRLQDPE